MGVNGQLQALTALLSVKEPRYLQNRKQGGSQKPYRRLGETSVCPMPRIEALFLRCVPCCVVTLPATLSCEVAAEVLAGLHCECMGRFRVLWC